MTFDLTNYSFEPGNLNEKNVIWIKFPNEKILRESLKSKFPSAKWDIISYCWYIPDNNTVREQLNLKPLHYTGKTILKYIHSVNQPALKNLIEELNLRAYSKNTIKTYSIEFAQLLYLLKEKPVDQLSVKQIRSYILYCISTLNLSENQIHSRLNAIKFYFEKVLKREAFCVDIPRPKKKLILPKALSKEEIKKLFSVIRNHKHLLMMKLCYGMGLRVSEIVNLKISDIDSTDRKSVV